MEKRQALALKRSQGAKRTAGRGFDLQGRTKEDTARACRALKADGLVRSKPEILRLQRQGFRDMQPGGNPGGADKTGPLIIDNQYLQ